MFQCPRLLLVPSKLKRNFTSKAASNEIVNEATTKQSLIGVYALKHHKQMSPTLCNSQQALFISFWHHFHEVLTLLHKQAFQSIFSASKRISLRKARHSVGGWQYNKMEKLCHYIAAVVVLCTHKGGQISGIVFIFCALLNRFSERQESCHKFEFYDAIEACGGFREFEHWLMFEFYGVKNFHGGLKVIFKGKKVKRMFEFSGTSIMNHRRPR